MGGRGEWGQILKALRRSVMKSYLDSERLRRWCPWCRVFVSPLEKKNEKSPASLLPNYVPRGPRCSVFTGLPVPGADPPPPSSSSRIPISSTGLSSLIAPLQSRVVMPPLEPPDSHPPGPLVPPGDTRAGLSPPPGP